MSTQAPPKRRAAQATDKPVKRTRVSRACDQCRTAREKCDGAQPICSTCSISKRTCTYTANVKKRGIQPGYIRALELALAYLFQHNPENEKLVNDKLAQGGSSSLLLSRDSKESNKLHKRWRKAQCYADIDRLLSGGESSRHDQSEPSPDSDDEQSDAKEPLFAATHNTRNLSSNPQNIVGSTQDAKTPTSLRPSVTSDTTLFMPLDSWRLVEVYFTYTQSWFPISEKNTVLKTLYSYPQEGLKLRSLLDSGDHAELWSILAVASANSASTQQSSIPAAQLYETARSLVPSELISFGLGHVRALLNLAIIDVGRQVFGAAWLLAGYASRILEVMDRTSLMLDPRHKHVFHSCFVLDSILALHLGRGPYFDAEHVASYGSIDEDGLDEWQPWSDTSLGDHSRTPTLAFSSLNAMLRLLDIIHDHATKHHDKLTKLETWKTSLPSKLASICTTTPSGHRTPAAVLLQSSFYCVTLALVWSEFWLLRLLDLLESAQDFLGWQRLPPVLYCLLEFVYQQSIPQSLGRSTSDRLLRLRTAMNSAWPKLERGQVSPARGTELAIDVHTPMPYDLRESVLLDDALGTPSSFNPGPSGMVSMATPSFVKSTGTIRPQMPPEAMYPTMPNDLESFFDELASLDATNNLDNQPQFMQNLGFAPDANMADLFSEYIPLSTTFMSQENEQSINLDHYGFYEGT